jgi:methionine-rich copper-binding protein CopC
VTRLISGAAAAAFLLLLSAVPAVAHAELEQSDPADGATISTPYKLTATFSEEFSADPHDSFIRVQNSTGAVVAEGGQSASDNTMMTADLPALDPGKYTVRWQTTTVDDNGVERGTFTFNVAAAIATDSPGSPLPTAGVTSTPTAGRPTASAPARTAAPTSSPTASGGQPAAGSTDVLLAIVLAVIVLAGLGGYLYMRSRR